MPHLLRQRSQRAPQRQRLGRGHGLQLLLGYARGFVVGFGFGRDRGRMQHLIPTMQHVFSMGFMFRE